MNIEKIDTTVNFPTEVLGQQLRKAPQPALTASDGTLANAVLRIAELESRLRNLNLIK